MQFSVVFIVNLEWLDAAFPRLSSWVFPRRHICLTETVTEINTLHAQLQHQFMLPSHAALLLLAVDRMDVVAGLSAPCLNDHVICIQGRRRRRSASATHSVKALRHALSLTSSTYWLTKSIMFHIFIIFGSALGY